MESAPMNDAWNVLLYDHLTPRLRNEIITYNHNSEQILYSWQQVCGSAGNRLKYLVGAQNLIDFLIKDLLLDHSGDSYRLSQWTFDYAKEVASDKAQNGPVDLSRELMLDPAYVKTKLSERVMGRATNTVFRLRCDRSQRMTRLGKDKELLAALYRLKDDKVRPEFFDQILTEDKKKRIEYGINRASGKSKLWDLMVQIKNLFS